MAAQIKSQKGNMKCRKRYLHKQRYSYGITKSIQEKEEPA